MQHFSGRKIKADAQVRVKSESHIECKWYLFQYMIRIYWTLCDGGEPNRTFAKMLFGGDDPVERKFVTYNVHTGGELAVMIDCKVNTF